MTEEKSAFEAALKDFKRSVEITRDVRFQANLRLIKRQRWSSYVVSLLSLYVISMSLIPNIVSLNPQQSQILLSISVILSVFIIFTSLIDGSQNFYYQGELLHRCARRVATVHHDLKNIDVHNNIQEAKTELRKLQDDYRQALDDCPINHENVDFLKIQTTKPHLFPNNYYKYCMYIQIQCKRIWYHIESNSWMLPHAIVIVGSSIVIFQFLIANH